MTTRRGIYQSVEQLRQEFDAGFSEPVVVRSNEQKQPILEVLAGTRHWLVRLADVAGVMLCPPLTPVPSHDGSLRGIAGVRGKVAGAYSLAQLLGQEGTGGSPRWLLLCREDESVALLVEELVGTRHLVVEVGRDTPLQDGSNDGVVDLVTFREGLLPLINMSQLLRKVLSSSPEEGMRGR